MHLFLALEKENKEMLSGTSDIAKRYTTALEAINEIACTYFFAGRFKDAVQTLRLSLELTEAQEVTPQSRLILLLLYGKVLLVEHLIRRNNPELMFSVIRQAKALAEKIQVPEYVADAVSLLGEACCNATTMSILESGNMPFGRQDKYHDALAYQQEALKLRETLHDSKGCSESHFLLGLIYQFWQQNELAREHFMTAIQIAEDNGLVLEQAEPNRHLMFDARLQGDLDQALLYGERALFFREAGGFKPYQPLDHLALRDVYRQKGDAEKAQFHERQAMILAEEMGVAEHMTFVSASSERL